MATATATAAPPPPHRRLLLLAVCGLPGSGKSRLAQLLQQQLPGAQAVAFDDHAADGADYAELRHRATQAVAAALNGAAAAATPAAPPLVVIADDTFHLASMRRALYRLAREGQSATVSQDPASTIPSYPLPHWQPARPG